MIALMYDLNITALLVKSKYYTCWPVDLNVIKLYVYHEYVTYHYHPVISEDRGPPWD